MRWASLCSTVPLNQGIIPDLKVSGGIFITM